MRCLYCGKELALLKRLTKGGEFCSDAHKHSYQEEYNRLGLSRLLQARSRADESKVAQKPPVGPAAPVAVAERSGEEIAPEVEEVVAQVQEVAMQTEEVAVQEVAPPPPPVASRAIAAPEPPPPAMVGFIMETPSIAAPPEPKSYLEPWVSEEATAPASPPPTLAWHLEGPAVKHPFYTLPSADLLPLEMQAGVCENSIALMDTSVTPRESVVPRVHLSLPLTVTSSHEFQRGGSVAIEILPRPSESSCYASLNGALDFSFPVGVQVLDLLDLAPAGIAYPAEECEVTVPESWASEIMSEGPVDLIVPAIPRDDAPAPEPPDQPATVPTPRAALQALSKLHQDMRDRQEAKPATPPSKAPLLATEAAPPEAKTPEPSPAEKSPREAALIAIPVKSFAPPKATAVIDASALLTNGHPLLPRLKALPLRPKVAPPPRGFSPHVQPMQTVKPAPTTETPKPAQPAPPAAKKTLQPADAAKAQKPAPAPAQPIQSAQSASPPKPEPSAKPVPVKSVPAVKTQTSPPSQTQKPEPAAATKASPPPKSEPVQKLPASKEPPAVRTPAGKAPAVKANAAAPEPAPAASIDHTVPNFGAVVNTSMFGSLKVKIGIAALAAVIGIGVYVQVAGKAKASANPAKTSDVGMSIMVGEGGWVENWAGDPAGLHSDRQITIYRPSLKLSDYRIEFQGQIDTKSIGWIFRAADPDNYYAMKLQLVSQELPLTVVLYKYIVLKGRQVQVGRVPIDAPVKNDTVFSIRMDVRGPKFNTYVQGQPVDVWTDDQIKSGGVGFLNERSERGKIKSVSLSYLSGGIK
jgi:hypothetical protein